MRYREELTNAWVAELRRRKVFRVAVVYAATVFMALQAADSVLPRQGVPELGMSLDYGGVRSAEAFPKAEQAARRALALDPQSAEALIVLGFPVGVPVGRRLDCSESAP